MTSTGNIIDTRLPLSFRAFSMTDQILASDNVSEVITFDAFTVSIGSDVTLNTSGDSTELTFKKPANYRIAVDAQVDRQSGGMSSKWFMWPEINIGAGWVQTVFGGTTEFFSNTSTDELSASRGKALILQVLRPGLRLRIRHEVDVAASSTGVVAKLKSGGAPVDVPSCAITGFWMWPIQGP